MLTVTLSFSILFNKVRSSRSQTAPCPTPTSAESPPARADLAEKARPGLSHYTSRSWNLEISVLDKEHTGCHGPASRRIAWRWLGAHRREGRPGSPREPQLGFKMGQQSTCPKLQSSSILPLIQLLSIFKAKKPPQPRLSLHTQM